MKTYFIISTITVAVQSLVFSQSNSMDLNEEQWDLSRAKTVEHLGRTTVMGTALLKDIEFKNGIIEVDIATLEKSRSYPGISFRMKDQLNYERVYIRPHRSPFYDDALQYAPVSNGVDSWQLHYGIGETASIDIPGNTWNHLKIIVAGNQAQVFWNDDEQPALIIQPLEHGENSGNISLSGPMDGSAYFSNFSYERIDSLSLPPLVPKNVVVGIITDWELSEPLLLKDTDFSKHPDNELLKKTMWTKVKSDGKGLVNISKYNSRKSRLGDCIYARTIINVEKDTLMKIGFGYSDYITIFFNGLPIFFGNSNYQSRDKSFLGIIGYNDNIFLPLKKGDNELLILVGESMGGWGFCFRKEDEIFIDENLKKLWSLKDSLSLPESVVYDELNEVCYVSNYFNDGNEYISKISTTGEVIEKEWIKGVRMPTGLDIDKNYLYVVTRVGLLIIDISKSEIINTIKLNDMIQPNDVAVAADGSIYISDMPGDAIFRYKEGKLEKWLGNIDKPNGLLIIGSELLIGHNEKLSSANTSDKSRKPIAELERGALIDGIQLDGKGNYLISDYNGKLYSITPSGQKKVLLNTATPGNNIADFLYIKSKKLFLIPTFSTNSIDAYKMK
jgi:DNA-binding beta-propeller fold protein YncE